MYLFDIVIQVEGQFAKITVVWQWLNLQLYTSVVFEEISILNPKIWDE